jgi:hypothetical protein
MARRILGVALGAISVALLASAPSAVADGLPVPGGVTPSSGAPGADGIRYVARTKAGVTTVRELSASGLVLQRSSVPGTYMVPAVALDGSPGGLSADGRTLVLIKPRTSIPQTATHLLLLNADGLGVRDRLTLKGDFGFDAISPDGARMYFIHYLTPANPTHYAVRAYDVSSSALLPDPIVDPNEEDPDEMRGYPLTRATSPDGRWAYTLYDGAGKHPFIHALDTAEGRAVCIDTPSLANRRDLYSLGLGTSGDGSTLTVSDGGRPLALVDTRTFAVRGPSEPAPAPHGGDGGEGWRVAVPAAVVVALASAALVLIARRRHGGLAAGDA